MSVLSGGRAHSQIRDRIVGLRRVRADELLPNPKNWRRHPKAQAEALKGLLGEIGYADALLARETPDGLMLIDGHLRAETTPDVEVPVLVLDLDEAEADKLLLTLDPLAAMAEMDGPATKALLEGVESESEAVQTMLAGLRDQAQKVIGPEEGLTDPDAVPEAVEPVAKRGDVWVCGEHRVMCGDSTDEADVARLMAGEKVNTIVADPPYGIGLDTDYSWMKSKLPGKHQGGTYEQVVGDSEPFDAGVVRQKVSAPEEFWFGADYYVRTLPEGGSWFVWDKRLSEDADRGFGSAFELVWSRQAHKRTFLRHRWFGYFSNQGDAQEQQNRLHPTQKPTALIERLLAEWGKGEAVLDPFLGSGTTMIAAERLGRRCYGMEIEPRYVDVAVRRWEEFTGRKAERERDRTKAKAHA